MEKFYAVAEQALYEVIINLEKPSVQIIADKDCDIDAVGYFFESLPMLAIAKSLIFFQPKGTGDMNQVEIHQRKLEEVNTQFWGASTPLLVALFKSEEEARKCFYKIDLKPADESWLQQTKEVIDEIGEDHPTITICHHPGLALIECIKTVV